MPSWAWSRYLPPLGIAESVIEDFLPTTVGRWDGEIYSVGLWEAAVAMVTRKSVLDKYGNRVLFLKLGPQDSGKTVTVRSHGQRLEKGVHAAGRLDRDSEGLLILTDDGKLQARIANPNAKTEKTYLVQIEGDPKELDLAPLRNGIDRKGGPTRRRRRARTRRRRPPIPSGRSSRRTSRRWMRCPTRHSTPRSTA